VSPSTLPSTHHASGAQAPPPFQAARLPSDSRSALATRVPSGSACARDDGDEVEAIGDDTDDADGGDFADASPRRPHPFDALSQVELARRLRDDSPSLGSASLGRPNSGGLFNAVQLPEDPAWKRVDPNHAWATPETIDYLTRALHSVEQHYPGTSSVSIGHLSAQKGGPLRPHVSHQSGRDVDVGFYYSGEPNGWYRRATNDNLDVARTWWLVRTLVLETDIEMILLDQSLISLIEHHAVESGERREWVESLFHPRNGRSAVVRHASGHATHLHLRFYNPIAQESGRRLMPLLVERGIMPAPQKFVTHVARAGDTLAKLAARYSTTMQVIRQANAMKTYQLVAGAPYRIPVRGSVNDIGSVRVPTRRLLPPTRAKPD
jgi:murein endopeptidase